VVAEDVARTDNHECGNLDRNYSLIGIEDSRQMQNQKACFQTIPNCEGISLRTTKNP
jgi:hypothetical protein